MSKKFFTSLLSLLLLSNQLSAQPAKDEPIELVHCSIDVSANRLTATTIMQLEFYNPNAKVLDGEYNFSLMANQVVTGFALDINGHLREGVIVDKQQGRVAYESIIRRRVDPGLLEMTAGNNYRVRIYPMPAKGTRKIKIIIAEILSSKTNVLAYHLPLDIPYQVKELKTSLVIAESNEMPVAREGLLKGKVFEKEKPVYRLAFAEKNIELKQPLSFEIPLVQNSSTFCINKETGAKTFALQLKPVMENTTAASINSATVFWDISSSAAKRNIKKEIAFLDSLIQERKIPALTIVTFSNTVHTIKTFKGNETGSIRRFLESQQYDGGTQLGSLDCNFYNSDIFILCSDGQSNFGSDQIKLNGKAVYCINSSASSNQTLLQKIAAKSGGNYIDLYKNTVEECVATLKSAPAQLISVKQAGKELETNIALPLQVPGWFTVTGSLRNFTDNIVLSFGKNGIVTREENISPGLQKDCLSNILDSAILLQQYATLQEREAEKEKIIAFAKLNHFASGSTSFIVLDNVDDYIQYGIVPPADLQEEYLQKIYVVKQKATQLKADSANEEINNLRKAVTTYNERIRWWGNNETLISMQDVEKKKEEMLVLVNGNTNTTEGQTVNAKTAEGSFKFTSNSLQEVVVVGYGTQRRRDLTGSVTTISSSQITRYGALTVPQALEGRVAGLQVVHSGAPGGFDRILVRGQSSVTGKNQPLYVLDGVPIDDFTMNTLNTNNIESITVYKDIQASALFGSRAANGAIVITTKRGIRNAPFKPGVPKYKDLDDVDYVSELKDLDKTAMYQRYLKMKDSMGKEPAFYFDVAEVFFQSGSKENALRVLSNLTEMDNENHQLLRAMGYMLESWKMYATAIDGYKKALTIKEEEPQSYRDLALAYERNQQYQEAVDLLYKITTKNFFQYEDRYRGLKSLLLNEMNAIINRHRDSIDLSAINKSVIKPLPVDIRVVIDWNKDETDIDLHIIEPGGEECFYSHKQTQAGGRLSEDFTQGYGPEEYQIKSAKKGKYLIRVKYYGDRYQKQQVPSFIKLTIYKNFGKLNQAMTTESFLMDNQDGIIEMGEIKIQ